MTPKRVFLGTCLVAIVIALAWLLMSFRRVLVLFFLGFVISTIFQPLITRLQRYSLTLRQSTAIVFSGVGLIFVLLFVISAPPLFEQSTLVSSNLSATYSQIRNSMTRSESFVIRRAGFTLPVQSDNFFYRVSQGLQESTEEGDGTEENAVSDETQNTAEEAAAIEAEKTWNTLNLAVETVIAIVVVFAVAYYWTIEGAQLTHVFLLMVPIESRADIRKFVQDVEAKVGQYATGQSLLCLIIGASSFLLYFLIGLPDMLALALFAGLMEAVPVVGPTIGAIPALVLALSVSPTHALWVVLGTIVIQQVENNFLVPRIMQKVLGVRPLVTLLALSIFGALFGLLGAIISIPLMVILKQLAYHFIFDQEGNLHKGITGRDQASLIRYETQQLIHDIRSQIRGKDAEINDTADELEDSLELLAHELDDILSNGQEPVAA